MSFTYSRENPKYEARNTKQIRISKFEFTKTRVYGAQTDYVFDWCVLDSKQAMRNITLRASPTKADESKRIVLARGIEL